MLDRKIAAAKAAEQISQGEWFLEWAPPDYDEQYEDEQLQILEAEMRLRDLELMEEDEAYADTDHFGVPRDHRGEVNA